MRALIIFGSLVAVALGHPQYSYPGDPSHTLLPPGLGRLSPLLPLSHGGNKYLPPSAPVQEPIITKQFFLHTAPEDNDGLQRTKHLVIGRPQKNYRVVFIKAPATNNNNVRLTAELAPQEEKTVIYVLSQKEKELEVGDIAAPPPTQPTKPEVFFIKYKTPEEAAAAQKEIQSQYDKLGGSSEFSDQGTAPVSSVIGSLDGVAVNGGYDYNLGGHRTPDEAYLPPIYKH